jgi:hypothetical protein
VAANTAAVGSTNPLMAAGAPQQQTAYSNSKQGYPVIAPITAAAAGSSPKLCYPGSVPLTVSTAANHTPTAAGFDKMARTAGGQVTGSADPGEVRPEVNGEGEEYLQELIKERDSIESSTTSSLSKTHILRLLNKGDV